MRAHLNPVFEDDLATFLGFDSVSSVKFFTRLQIGDKVLHSRMYIQTGYQEKHINHSLQE